MKFSTSYKAKSSQLHKNAQFYNVWLTEQNDTTARAVQIIKPHKHKEIKYQLNAKLL